MTTVTSEAHWRRTCLHCVLARVLRIEMPSFDVRGLSVTISHFEPVRTAGGRLVALDRRGGRIVSSERDNARQALAGLTADATPRGGLAAEPGR